MSLKDMMSSIKSKYQDYAQLVQDGANAFMFNFDAKIVVLNVSQRQVSLINIVNADPSDRDIAAMQFKYWRGLNTQDYYKTAGIV
jgi:hypothetical protein